MSTAMTGGGLDHDSVLADARRWIADLAAALTDLPDQLDENFAHAVRAILDCRGHVVVSGAGTSAAIAARLAHLLTVCGAPAFPLPPSDASHGGAAAAGPDDLLIAISKGGESDELNDFVRVASGRGVRVIALTQDLEASLAQLVDVPLTYRVPDHLDGEGFIALGSSIATAAVSDALCAAVLHERGFDTQQLATIHPGGAVGKALRDVQA